MGWDVVRCGEMKWDGVSYGEVCNTRLVIALVATLTASLTILLDLPSSPSSPPFSSSFTPSLLSLLFCWRRSLAALTSFFLAAMCRAGSLILLLLASFSSSKATTLSCPCCNDTASGVKPSYVVWFCVVWGGVVWCSVVGCSVVWCALWWSDGVWCGAVGLLWSNVAGMVWCARGGGRGVVYKIVSSLKN